jgi:predicted membrane protein
LDSDWNTPPYAWSWGAFFNWNQWQAIALTRPLFFLALLVFVIYYIDYTTTLAISSARMLWTRIILGGLYVVIAGFIARIVLEIVLALFVVKDVYVGKNLHRKVMASAPANTIIIANDNNHRSDEEEDLVVSKKKTKKGYQNIE